MSEPIVVVMAKAPRAGDVKTRLVPPLTEAEAASLAACFLRDTVINARQAISSVLVAYTPADARSDLESMLPSDLLWFAQDGQNLGERLESVVSHISSLGFSPLLIVGADSPIFPTLFGQEALNVLISGEAEIALGPTEDGGYYLVGLQRAVPRLFQNVDWSTRFANQQTEANAAALNLRLHSLPRWYDIDTPADLERLRDEMASEKCGSARRTLLAGLSINAFHRHKYR